jgi:C4-dicarboxylate-specific signal transduction histidine kinase
MPPLPPETPALSHPSDTERGAATILVVEDDAALRSLVEERLREHGYQTAAAGSGGEALAWLERHSARLMVTAYVLPDMLGGELVERLRARGIRVPFVVATAHGDEVLAAEMMKHGARDYVIKGAGFLDMLPAVVDQSLADVGHEERLQAAEAELQRQQGKLQRAYEELEDRMRQRTAELAEANVRFRVEMDERHGAEERARQHQAELAHMASLSAVGQMVAEVAHELTQPLTAIAAYAHAAQRLLQTSGAGSAPELPQIVASVQAQADRAVKFVHRLGRVVAHGQRITAVEDLNLLIREALSMFTVEAQLLQVAVRFDPGEPLPPVAVNRLEIDQVLVNLIRNALAAMRESASGPHELRIATAAANGGVEVCVADTGVGLPPGDSERIFQRFFTTKRDAIGMGLPISRTIVENHGGRLWAAPNAGRGAVLRFTLPAHDGDADDAS